MRGLIWKESSGQVTHTGKQNGLPGVRAGVENITVGPESSCASHTVLPTTQQSLVNLVFVFAVRPLNRPSRVSGVDAEHAQPQHRLAGHNNRLAHDSATTRATRAYSRVPSPLACGV